MPAFTVRRAEDDLEGLHDVLHGHRDDLSETQRETIDETSFHEEPRHRIAERRGITMNTFDNHRKASCSTLRDAMTAVVDFCAYIDLPDCYDRIAETNERYAARKPRRAFRKKEKRSSSGGDRSNFEGDASNSRRDADKNARAADLSVGLTTKS